MTFRPGAGRATENWPRALAALALALVAAALVLALARPHAQQLDLPPPRDLAPGIQLYHVTDQTLVDPQGPLSIWMLRLNPTLVTLRSVLANDEIVGTETVASMAARHGALAAINAGFFQANGDPSGVLTLDGRLVSDTRRPRGAVGISRDSTGVKLAFARLRATAALTLERGGTKTTVAIDGIDTTRQLGKLMLFSPTFDQSTGAAKGGLEWVVDGQPPRIVSGPHRDGNTSIPVHGFVLSFGGGKAPPSLAALRRGTRVGIVRSYQPVEGEPTSWSSAQDIVGGAGLLIRDGRDVDDWGIEAFTKEFADLRHPRTLIGTGPDGYIWLITVDGRLPNTSVGMSLLELRGLAHRLRLTNALNLDGGGSTTMWVQGQVVNRPSDAAGPRQVSDALVVFPGAPKQ